MATNTEPDTEYDPFTPEDAERFRSNAMVAIVAFVVVSSLAVLFFMVMGL